MAELIKSADYNIVVEAKEIMAQWGDNKIEIDNAQAQKRTLFKQSEGLFGGRKVIDIENTWATRMSEFKRAMSNFVEREKLLSSKYSNSHLYASMDGLALKIAAESLVDLKLKLETAKILVPGQGYFKQLRELEEKVGQMEREKTSVTSTLQSVKLAYERLKNRIIRDMPETSEKYIQDAIASSDGNTWETDITSEQNDGDKNE